MGVEGGGSGVGAGVDSAVESYVVDGTPVVGLVVVVDEIEESREVVFEIAGFVDVVRIVGVRCAVGEVQVVGVDGVVLVVEVEEVVGVVRVVVLAIMARVTIAV